MMIMWLRARGDERIDVLARVWRNHSTLGVAITILFFVSGLIALVVSASELDKSNGGTLKFAIAAALFALGALMYGAVGLGMLASAAQDRILAVESRIAELERKAGVEGSGGLMSEA